MSARVSTCWHDIIPDVDFMRKVTFLHELDRICIEKGKFYLFFSLFCIIIVRKKAEVEYEAKI